MILTLLGVLVELFLLLLFVYSIMSWVIAYSRASYDSPLYKIQKFLSAVCDPVLRPIRRLIPPVRVGNSSLDLSVLVVFLVGAYVVLPLLR